MTTDIRGLSNAEIDTVAGGAPILLAALSACIEYTLHATDNQPTETSDTTDTGDTGDTAEDTGSDK